MTTGFSNYSELTETMKEWLGRGGDNDITLENNLNRFINLSEQEITTALKLLGIKRVLNGVFEIAENVLEKPAGWRSTVSWRLSGSSSIYQRTVDYIKAVYPDGHSYSTPLYFADYDYTHWLIGPTPDQRYNFQIEIYSMPQPLSAEIPTNWYIDQVPQALFFGAMYYANVFLKFSTRANEFKEMFGASLGTIKIEDLGTMISENQRKPK